MVQVPKLYVIGAKSTYIGTHVGPNYRQFEYLDPQRTDVARLISLFDEPPSSLLEPTGKGQGCDYYHYYPYHHCYPYYPYYPYCHYYHYTITITFTILLVVICFLVFILAITIMKL